MDENKKSSYDRHEVNEMKEEADNEYSKESIEFEDPEDDIKYKWNKMTDLSKLYSYISHDLTNLPSFGLINEVVPQYKCSDVRL